MTIMFGVKLIYLLLTKILILKMYGIARLGLRLVDAYRRHFSERFLLSIEGRTGLKIDVETRGTCGDAQEVMA